VLLRSIIVEREPIYRQQETVHGFASGMFGIGSAEMTHLSDDRLGRALDHLFDADRTALLTEVALAVAQRFDVNFDECHNDSTTISFCGSYHGASGRKIRGRTAPAITVGHSKDSRPDLKQLLFILTVTADGNIPVAFRCTDGNTSDSRTHIETWNTLRALAGRSDFLYVADSNFVREKRWTISIARADASSPCCLAPAWKTPSSAGGSRPTPPTGRACGIVPIHATATGRATAGMAFARRYCRPKPGPWYGCGVRC
jgi:hypothetical protein